MRISIITIVLLVLGQTASAQQSKIKRGDQLYNLLAYSEAIPEYESALWKNDSTLDVLSLKLAKSYYYYGDLEKARNSFSGAEGMKASFSAEDCFVYSQCLKQLGDYSGADLWMKKYASMMPGSLSADDFNNHLDYLEAIRNDQKHFMITTVNFNSKMNDFGGYEYKKGQVVFILSDRNSTPVKRIFGWNSMNFLDFLVVSNPNNSNLKVVNHSSGNTKYHEGPICFTSDESRVYYTTNNHVKSSGANGQKGIQNLMLYTAKVSSNGKWQEQKALKINSKEYSVGHPTLSTDGQWLYFVSDMPGGFGGSDIYKAQILADGELGSPINLGQKVNTEKQEAFPWISREGQLFFSSNGLTGLGGLDIFIANLGEDGMVKAVKHTGPEINSAKDDFGLIFSSEGKKGYFSSNREGGQGNDDIYGFELIQPFKFSINLTGTVTDLATGDILKETEVKLMDENGNVLQAVKSDENGNYHFDLEPGKNYSISFAQSGFTDLKKAVNVAPQEQDLTLNAALAKVPSFGLLCKITEAESGRVLDGVEVKIFDPKTGNTIMDQLTSHEGLTETGLENIKLGDQLNLKVTISKEGYLSKTVDLNIKIIKEGIYNVHDMIDATIGKMEVGVDLASLIDIKPIYFDLGKYNIRKDATIELDKIVKIMNEYPTMEIELGSHTDCRGSIVSNEKLSSNRANASADYIKTRINNPERIYGKGYGESKLKVDCPCEGAVKSDCPELEHQKNRRTEFVIIKM